MEDGLQSDEEYEDIVTENWAQIRTHSHITNRLQDTHNVRLIGSDITEAAEQLRRVFRNQNHAFKINVSAGFVLRHNSEETLHYYYASHNTLLFEEAILIANGEDLEQFIDRLRELDLLEWCRQQRPNTKYTVYCLTNLLFYVTHLRQHPIGSRIILPDFIKNKKCIRTFICDRKGVPFHDKLCLFRCLAWKEGMNDRQLEDKVIQLLSIYKHDNIDTFPGITLEELDVVENIYRTNINVYQLLITEDEDDQLVETCEVIRRSLNTHPDTVHLNLYESHFSLITDLNQYTKTWRCPSCSKLYALRRDFERHLPVCCNVSKSVYPGGPYRMKPTIFEQLADEGITVTDEFYPYRATFDCEVYFESNNNAQHESFTIKNKHCLMSISVCSNIPGHDEPVCFVNEGDQKLIVHQFVEYLLKLSTTAKQLLMQKYQHVFDELQIRMEDSVEPICEDSVLSQLKSKLLSWINELPVIGFNSAKYDFNVLREVMVPYLLQQEAIEFVVRTQSTKYMCIKTKSLKFLDMMNYVAPGYNYSNYLKAYGVEEKKGFFPYEYVDGLHRLKEGLPPKEAFHSTLKNTDITDADYELVVNTWQSNGMATLKDLLIWYNNKDVKPFLQAIDNQFSFYRDEMKVDMFKDGISLPGLSLKILFNTVPQSTFFELYRGRAKHDMVKNNLVGGPSIIFKRYAEAGGTTIRNTSVPCKQVLGLDASALYLSCLMKPMPTGFHVQWTEEDGLFRGRQSERHGHTARQWLEWKATQDRTRIQHQFNGGEKRIGNRGIPVDGFSEEHQKIYQFHGCYYHGHHCYLTKGLPQEMMEKRRKHSDEIDSYLGSLSYDLEIIRECQYYRIRKEHDIRDNHEYTYKSQKLTQEELTQAIKDGSMFGMAEVDVEVPIELQKKFSDLPPIFKNTNISWDDIGDHMQQYLTEKSIKFTQRRSLISSFHGTKILLATPLIKWYLEHGIKVTKIYTLLQYQPQACFKEFGEMVSNARRDGDKDTTQQLRADTCKLIGNSAYGKTATNKAKHVDVKFTSLAEAKRLVNDVRFRSLVSVDHRHFEVTLSKKITREDLPLQVAFFVYQYGKLRMLEFVYDLLKKYFDDTTWEPLGVHLLSLSCSLF